MSGLIAEAAEIDMRREGESPAAHMFRGLFSHVARGLAEAGMPLSADQEAFLLAALNQLEMK